ncbi:TIGR04104 family putative zinc finger protein [Ammoniphilus oxalaticus]|uniref:TIGR04104 family putative zinc finger protein n=1 Tax=Ammoniphilus oxalaticus TaxID=66863 RepID=UPI000E74B284|nr:TIGR04104 family putative zinc finger protein [Ammoniphilus oxalaticus]
MKGRYYMPTCQSCKRKWTWKETIKTSLALKDSSMNCPHCSKLQYLTAKSKKRSTMSMFFIIAPLAIFFNDSPFIGLVALIVTCLLFMGIWPFLIELSNKKESLRSNSKS